MVDSTDSSTEYETVTDAFGFVWENGGGTTDDHLAWGGHEPALIQIAHGLLPEGGVFLDIGAHVGLYTIRLSDKARTVYAIEANPKTYEVLMRNVERNAKEDSDFRCLNVAAWDCNDVLTLVDENDKSTGGSTHCEPFDGSVSKFADVPKTQAIPLDDVLGPGDPVDLVKIDVEGAEARVLEGMRKIVMLHRPTLFIEMHDEVYKKPEVRQNVLRFLESVEYRWDDSLTYGACYYLIGKPAEVQDEWTPEVVKPGG